MNEEVKSLLREELKSELNELSKMEVGTDGYLKTVDGVCKITDRLNDLEKTDIEHKDKVAIQQMDNDYRLQQMNEERKDRFMRNCISAASIVVPVWVTVWGVIKTFEFEKEGTITTMIGRGFINKLLPRK